jgi:hypothetical protein
MDNHLRIQIIIKSLIYSNQFKFKTNNHQYYQHEVKYHNKCLAIKIKMFRIVFLIKLVLQVIEKTEILVFLKVQNKIEKPVILIWLSLLLIIHKS